MTHMSKIPEYKIWIGIKQRCLNPKCRAYARYGGRGITVCEKWLHSFEAFLADVGWRPSVDHSIDRIDCDGHYEPDNVRWATRKEQMNNTRRTLFAEWEGQVVPLSHLESVAQVCRVTLAQRLRAGKTGAQLVAPAGHRPRTNFVDWKGERMSMVDLAIQCGIPYAVLNTRIRCKQWTVERAVSQPIRKR